MTRSNEHVARRVAQQQQSRSHLPARPLRSQPFAKTSRTLRRRVGLNVHPCLFPRSKHCGYPFVRGGLLVLVRGSEFSVGDVEYCATHTTVVSAVEGYVSMMRLTACSHDLRVRDPYYYNDRS